MPGNDVLKKSVTLEDIPTSPASGGIFHILMPAMASSAGPNLPPFWSPGRDWILYQTIFREAQWGNGIRKAISKMSAQSWDIEGDAPLKARHAREMLMAFDLERGWVSGLAKHLQAFLLTGNGAFLEIVHQTNAAGSKVLGLVHLDTFRCTRTGDPDYPAIYRDRKGTEHVLKAHQIIMLSDVPDQSELWYGVGHCAAETAYPAICRLEAIERYVTEKVSGKRPLAIYVVNGLNQTQLVNAVEQARADSTAKGLVTYMGAAIVSMVDPTATPTVATIPLASLPDGFDALDERKNAYLTYANAIGIDPQLLDPDLLASRALGTGAQSRVISEKQESIGLAAWRKSFEHAVNEFALDDSTTFAFHEIDLEAQTKEAEISQIRATVLNLLVTGMIITQAQALQMGVDWDEIPEEFLPEDVTPDTSLTDDVKPEGAAPADAAPTDVQTSAADLAAQLLGTKAFVQTGSIAALTDAAMRNIQEAITAQVKQARDQGIAEAQESEAMRQLHTAAKALEEAQEEDDEHGSEDMATNTEAIVEAIKAVAANPPVIQVTNVIPEQKSAPPIVNVTPQIVVPAPIVIVEQRKGTLRKTILRDKEGQMIGSEEVWEPEAA